MIEMADDIIGMVGLGLIVMGWIPGILETVKTGNPGMTKRFMALYFLGSISLGFYAWQLNSVPFIILNVLAALVPLVHLYFYAKKYGLGKILTPSKAFK